MSIVKNLSPGVETTLVMSSLMVSKLAVGVPASNRKYNLSPPATNLVLFGSLVFSGLMRQVMRPYVTSFALALGTLSFGMKKIVSVPAAQHGIPCASRPSLLL